MPTNVNALAALLTQIVDIPRQFSRKRCNPLSLLKWNRIYALILLYEVQLLAVTTGISTHPKTVIVNHDPEAPALKGGPTNGDLC